MIKNVTPLLKTNILSLDKSKKPTIRNIFVHILSLMLKKNNTYGHHIHRYLLIIGIYYMRSRNLINILIFIALLSQKQYSFFDYRLRTFYLSVWLGHIIVDQKCLSILKKMNAFPEKFTFQFE